MMELEFPITAEITVWAEASQLIDKKGIEIILPRTGRKIFIPRERVSPLMNGFELEGIKYRMEIKTPEEYWQIFGKHGVRKNFVLYTLPVEEKAPEANPPPKKSSENTVPSGVAAPAPAAAQTHPASAPRLGHRGPFLLLLTMLAALPALAPTA